MATARRVEIPPAPPTPVLISVELSLAPEEAHFLAAILNRIGGSPSGPRGNADQILNALAKAGITKELAPVLKVSDKIERENRAIYFKG
jgi:hypothetical protein